MQKSSSLRTMFGALALSLAGCATGDGSPGARHLSATQCRDLTALRDHALVTAARNLSELAALRSAGYDPSRFYDPYYPDDLQQAQRQIELWYQAECR
jgi:hypothetical protein